jgi:hypothetical protein
MPTVDLNHGKTPGRSWVSWHEKTPDVSLYSLLPFGLLNIVVSAKPSANRDYKLIATLCRRSTRASWNTSGMLRRPHRQPSGKSTSVRAWPKQWSGGWQRLGRGEKQLQFRQILFGEIKGKVERRRRRNTTRHKKTEKETFEPSGGP